VKTRETSKSDEVIPKDLAPGPYREVEKEARKAERGIGSLSEVRSKVLRVN
jgi:hypothetical protein